MMTPYAAPGPFYPTGVYPHAAMSTPQGAYPGYGVQPTAAGTAAASSDPNAYRAAQGDGKAADGQMGSGAEPKVSPTTLTVSPTTLTALRVSDVQRSCANFYELMILLS